MVAHHFFKPRPPITLKEIARVGDLELKTPLPDGWLESSVLEDVSTLAEGQKNHIGVLHNPKYNQFLATTELGACIVPPERGDSAPVDMVVFVSKTPYRSFAKVTEAFYPGSLNHTWAFSQTSDIHETVEIAEGCRLEPGVVIGADAKIGPNTYVGAGTTIGAGVVIGRECQIGANCTISHSFIGNHVTLHPGVRLGQPGFGFHVDSKGHLSIPQLGCARIEDYVDIGANTCIDRGSLSDTVIGEGTRIDNLVQVAHNVKIGKRCAIAAQVGISGSTEIGDHTMIAGQVGLAGHLKVGSYVQISAQSGVIHDIPEGEIIMGTPAEPHTRFWQKTALLNRIIKDRKKYLKA